MFFCKNAATVNAARKRDARDFVLPVSKIRSRNIKGLNFTSLVYKTRADSWKEILKFPSSLILDRHALARDVERLDLRRDIGTLQLFECS